MMYPIISDDFPIMFGSGEGARERSEGQGAAGPGPGVAGGNHLASRDKKEMPWIMNIYIYIYII